MFQLDDTFLQEVGLLDLPEDQKKAFLEHIYSELELRVGTKLSEGLNDDQMAQFEAFVDRDEAKVQSWFDKYLPNYLESPDYMNLKKSAPTTVSDLEVLCEYGSLKWLEMNRPDYRQVVAAQLQVLKGEITQNKDSILGSKSQTL
jgi:hypothetical protein